MKKTIKNSAPRKKKKNPRDLTITNAKSYNKRFLKIEAEIKSLKAEIANLKTIRGNYFNR